MGYRDRDYYEDDYNGGGFAVADAQLDARVGFIRRVYSHVFGAILTFIALEMVFFNVPAISDPLIRIIGHNWWIALIAFMIVSWVAQHWAETGASEGKQYFGLGLYVVCEALIFVPLLAFAQIKGSDVIPTAALITLVIWGGLTAGVFITKADFSFLRGLLMVCLYGAIGLVICSLIFGFSLGVLFSVGMVVLFSGFILYDTSNILHHYRTDQHVGAALHLFASIATLFWYVLRLVMYFSEE